MWGGHSCPPFYFGKAMEPNAFIGQRTPPTKAALAKALGASVKLWNAIVAALKDEAPSHEWSSYSPKAGWALKLKKKDRTILYLSPCNGSFRASFVLGDKAVEAAKSSDLPKPVIKLIAEAKKYAEGTGIRIDVNNLDDVQTVKKLAAIKLQN